MTLLVKTKAKDVLPLLLEYDSSLEVKGAILDPLDRFGNFILFDEFDDPFTLPRSLSFACFRQARLESLV